MNSNYIDQITLSEISEILKKLIIYANEYKKMDEYAKNTTIEAISFNLIVLSILTKRISDKIRASNKIKWFILELSGTTLVHHTVGIESNIILKIIADEFPLILKELSIIKNTIYQ